MADLRVAATFLVAVLFLVPVAALASGTDRANAPADRTAPGLPPPTASLGGVPPPREMPRFDPLGPGDGWANWSLPSGPSGRTDAQLAFDPALNGTLLFGGQGPNGTALNDTWAFAGGLWTNLTGTAGPAPPARWSGAMTYDAATDSVVLFGGQNATTFFNDTWSFAGGGWHPIATLHAPTPRDTSLAYDNRSGSLLLYGGTYRTLGPTPGAITGYNDTWMLHANGWANISASAGPGPNSTGSIVYDAGDRYVFLLGGSPTHDHVWGFYRGRWHLVATAGAVPDPVVGNASLSYDAEGGVVLYVGAPIGDPSQTVVWGFRAGIWTNLTAYAGSLASPSGRDEASLADDPAANATLWFGGAAPVGGPAPSLLLNETWAFASVPFRLNFSVTPAATDTGIAVVLSDAIDETTGQGWTYTESYGHLPGGCLSGNLTLISCAPLAPGAFVVNTTMTRSDGAAENASALLTVNPLPSVNVSAPVTTGDVGQPLAFDGTVTNGTPPFRWSWTFGDGTNGSGPNATHAFGASGEYTVNLTLTDAVGSRSEVSIPVTIHAGVGLSVGANRTTTDEGLPIAFFADPVGGTLPYAIVWQFPGGGSASGLTAARAFGAPGTYPVNATVTDAEGFEATAQISVTIYAPPTVAVRASALVTDGGLPVNLTTVLSGGHGPFSVGWRFSDGGNASGANVSHAFFPGPAWAEAEVTDGAGVLTTATLNLTVHAAPSAGVSLTSIAGCLPALNVSVTATVGAGTAPFAYAWAFGGTLAGPAAADPNASHVYSTAGTFPIEVTVTDAAGGTATATLNYTATACPATTHTGGGGGPAATPWPEYAALALAVAVVGLVVLYLSRRRRPPAEAAPVVPPTRPAWSEDEGPPPSR